MAEVRGLSGMVALVTGGSRGIGAASARALAQKGADVAISFAASPDKAAAVVAELVACGVRAKAFMSDQADVSQVNQLIADTVNYFGRLDILVANAGVFDLGQIDTTTDTAGLDRMRQVNVAGVLAAIRAASRVIGEGGRIVTMSSSAAIRVGTPGMADYASTKAAIAGYVRGAARDLGPRKITINALAIGPVETDMNPDAGDFANWLRTATALGRYAKPEEIAAVVAFLASPEASYITGSLISVDGGLNA